MEELLAHAMRGVDPDAPDAFARIFVNLMGMIPWTALFWWNLAFMAVGWLLGYWRGRPGEGVVWAALLGPIGWIVVLVRPPPRATPPVPPPMPPTGRRVRRRRRGHGID